MQGSPFIGGSIGLDPAQMELVSAIRSSPQLTAMYEALVAELGDANSALAAMSSVLGGKLVDQPMANPDLMQANAQAPAAAPAMPGAGMQSPFGAAP